MKVDDALQTLTHFFNDIIGTLIPGLVLLVGVTFIHFGSDAERAIKTVQDNGYLVYLAIAIAFALGHAILSIYKIAIEPILPAVGLAKGKHNTTIVASPPFSLFKAHVEARVLANPVWQALPAAQNWSFSDVRNVAMSMPGEAASVGRRFMFISLLCNGVGMALWILSIDLCFGSLASNFFPSLSIQGSYGCWTILPITILFFVGATCFHRGDEFLERALSAPFGIALASLILTP